MDRWVATSTKPEIIDTDYTLFLDFYKDSHGTLQARIQSNKENRTLHFTIDSVLIDDHQIDFKISNDRFGLSAQLEDHGNSIQLIYTNAGGPRHIELKKLKKSEQSGYRPKLTASYQYEVPKASAAIQSASLEEVGINTSMLKLMDVINNGKYEHIHSIIITRKNKLVFEEYFHGYDRDYLHDIRSSFKSIASILYGKVDSAPAKHLNDAILDYYPDYDPSDVRKKNMTVHHALTMSTGLLLEDEDDMQWNNINWVDHKLGLPLEHVPGEHYEYSSGGTNLLTGVIQQRAGKYLPLYLYEEVLIPMDIHHFQMRVSPMNRAYLSGDFYLRPIDFTKFGLLVLNQGRFNEKQIVSAEWITQSTQPHIKGSYPKDTDYGYLWRLLKREVNGRSISTIEAWGNGGQYLIIIPTLEMTITFTGGNYNLFPEMEEVPFELLTNYIFPAVD